MTKMFLWTGGSDQAEDPTWAVKALQAGALKITNDGTPDVRLVTSTGQTAAPGDCLALRDGTIHVIHAGVPTDGCRHCGLPAREHMQRWEPGPGWHKWAAPTQEQIKDRMLARRAQRKGQ